MNYQQAKIGKELAIRQYDSEWWKGKPATLLCGIQLLTAELIMPFDVFQEAVEKCLGRPVFTHEFGMNVDGLLEEYLQSIGMKPKGEGQ